MNHFGAAASHQAMSRQAISHQPMSRQDTPRRDAAGPVAFQHAVEAHAATVLRVCRALVGMPDADDAWSETFLAALHAYPTLAGGANIEAWLVTIARRKCIDVLRTRARDPIPVDAVPALQPSRLGLPGAADEYAPLWQAIGRLPFVQRQAVVCHHLVGMSYADTADIIGNSPAAARRAGADGITTLRRLLAQRSREPRIVVPRAHRRTRYAAPPLPTPHSRTEGAPR